jgi:cyclic pyranopterin phosphate synthase
MPNEGVGLLPQKEILNFDEIANIVSYGVSQGIDKVRITGGEPLVRKGIVNLIQQIASIKGIKDLALTTNGILLPKYAQELKTAGLNRVNISLDTTDPEKYKSITRTGNITDVFKGIEAAKEAGLFPIKINCVIKKSMTEPNAQLVGDFAKTNNLEIRYIHEMNLEAGEFHVVEGGEGGNCISCNRLRLTSNGILKPCLFNDVGFNIRKIGIAEAYRLALSNKPESGKTNQSGKFYNIGG